VTTLAGHAHVQRPVAHEREAALGLVQLHGRHPDIQRDRVAAVPARLGETRLELGERRSAASRVVLPLNGAA
jgi:hypothetical protein